MKTKKNTEPQDFTLSFHLDKAGWFTATMEIEAAAHDFTVSYLSEPLRDFLRVILDVDGFYAGDHSGSNECKRWVVWQGEPWRYSWSFEARPNGVLGVSLSYCRDWIGQTPEAPEEVLFVTAVSFNEFTRQVYSQTRKILGTYGLLGYRDRWIDSDFPISDLMRVGFIVTGQEPSKHSLQADIEFLQGVLEDVGPDLRE